MEWTGRVALVTGAARGIGAATALALAQAGADVVVQYQRSLAAVEELRRRCSAPDRLLLIQADLRRPEGARELIEVARQRFDRLDFLVHAAAVTAPAGSRGIEEAVWDEAVAVHLRTPVELALRAAELMQKGAPGEAALAFIGPAGVERGEGTSTETAVTQGAMANLARHLARRLAPAVRVNAVLHGMIGGAMVESRTENAAERLRRTPMARLGRPEEVAELVMFLLGGTTFITGQAITVDGGMLL